MTQLSTFSSGIEQVLLTSWCYRSFESLRKNFVNIFLRN